MKAENTDPLSISCVTAARMLNVSRRTLQRWCAYGAVPHRRIGKKLLFSPRALRQWLDAGDESKT